MSFELWDGQNDCPIVNPVDGTQVFRSRTSAELEILRDMANVREPRLRVPAFSIFEKAAGLSYRLEVKNAEDGSYCFSPYLLPIDGKAPPTHWTLEFYIGGQAESGMTVKNSRAGAQGILEGWKTPRGQSCGGLVTFIEKNGLRKELHPHFIGAHFRYTPPRTVRNEAGLLWAASGRWHPPAQLKLIHFGAS